MKHRLLKWMSWVPVVVFVLWSIGQLLKDRSIVLGVMFYMPSVLLTVAYAMFALIAGWKKSRWWILYAGLTVPPVACVLQLENRWTPGSVLQKPDSVCRLVHWNLCRPVSRWPEQRERLRALAADVIILSETTDSIREADFPEHQVLQLPGMLIACRGRMTTSKSLVPGGVVAAYQVHCELPEGSLDVIVADMTSNFRIWRHPYLKSLVECAIERKADLVVGDLNTPRRSLAFDELPDGYRHAYDAVGCGWSYTWPVPLPVLAIDHCLCGPETIPVNYELQTSWLSDHRIQILDFGKLSWE